MREFKFRLWNLKRKQWETPALLECMGDDGILRPVGHYDDIEDYIIQQFTGIKDNNGEDIYEGDVLRCPNENEFEIIFDVGAFWAKRLNCKYYETKFKHLSVVCISGEVVGNIFEYKK